MRVGGVKLAAGTSARDDTAGHDDIIASFYPQFRVEFKLLEVLGNLGEDVLEHLLSLLFNLCRLCWHGSPVLSGASA